MHELDDTIQQLLDALKRDPDNAAILEKLTEVCIGHGRDDEAITFLRMLLFRRPSDLQARHALDSLLARHDPRYCTTLPLHQDDSGILVSAIVSTYNSARFIAGCLDDLEQQTIADRLEIIVIDSGSQEDEGGIVADFAKRYGNIRYERTAVRETVYGAWNRAIAVARGRYLTNANTDDRHCRDAFERMAAILEHNADVSLVYADQIKTVTENETFENHTATGFFSWPDWDRQHLLREGCFIGPQPMWRRSVHDWFGFFDGTMVSSGDFEFWLRISQLTSFYHIPLPLGLYLDSPSSVEHRNRLKRHEEDSAIFSAYRNAAKHGKIIRFQPFLKLRNIVQSPEDVTRIPALVQQLEQAMPPAVEGDAELARQYVTSRKALLASMPTPAAVEQFMYIASRLLLARQNWCAMPAASPSDISGNRNGAEEYRIQHDQLTAVIAEARCMALRGKVAEAVDILLHQGIAGHHGNTAPYQALADILIENGRFDDALQVAAEMPATDQAARHEIEAVCYAATGDDAAAALATEQARKAGGERAGVLVVLGTLAARKGDVDVAESWFRRALEVDPRCGKAWLSLGMIMWSGNNTTGAVRAALQAMRVTPTDPEIISICRDMADRCGRTAEVLELCREGIARFPDCRALAAAIAELLMQSGRLKDAHDAATAYLSRAGADDEIISLAIDARNRYAPPVVNEKSSETISLCMIVKNEEQVLARCLASVQALADEMIIVDTGSTDRTVDLATAFGARVFRFVWNGNFSDARNFGIDQAMSRWILVLDADEVLSPADHATVREAVSGSQKAAWSVMTRNYTPHVNTEGWTANDGTYPEEEQGGGWYPSWKIRLFPNRRELRFCGQIHEMVETPAREAGYELRKASFVVHHYGEMEKREADVAAKQRAYYELGKRKLAERPDDLPALMELAAQATHLGLLEEALQLWDRVLDLRPDTVEALFNKGYVLIGLKRYGEALTVSRKALEIDPGHKEAAFNYGTCELYAGDPARALAVVRPIAGRHGSYPLLQALLAALYLCCGGKEEAFQKITALKKMDYAIERYLVERAATLEAMGRGEAADSIRSACGKSMNTE